MHQLTPELEDDDDDDIEELLLLGVVGVLMVLYGSVEAGETVSGLELGFRIGDDDEDEEDDGDDEIVGRVGIRFGTVVIGVVMSFCDVEITCDSFIVLLLDPEERN